MEHDHCDYFPCASCAAQARVLREMAEKAEAERRRQMEVDDRAFKNNADLMRSGAMYWQRKNYREFMQEGMA